MSAGEAPSRQRAGAWEYAAALCLLGLGVYLIIDGVAYGTGTVRRMGPGFFPVAIGTLLAILALGIVLELFVGGGARRIDWPIRPILFVTASMLVFAGLVEITGIVPAAFLLVVVGSCADSSTTPLRAIVSGVVLAGIGWLVFIRGFGLPLEPFWW